MVSTACSNSSGLRASAGGCTSGRPAAGSNKVFARQDIDFVCHQVSLQIIGRYVIAEDFKPGDTGLDHWRQVIQKATLQMASGDCAVNVEYGTHRLEIVITAIANILSHHIQDEWRHVQQYARHDAVDVRVNRPTGHDRRAFGVL